MLLESRLEPDQLSTIEVPHTPKWRWLVAASVVVGVATLTVVFLGGSGGPSRAYALGTLLQPAATTVLNATDATIESNAIAALPSVSALSNTLGSQGVQVTLDGSVVGAADDDLAFRTRAFDISSIYSAGANAVRLGLDVQTAVSEVSGPTFGLNQAVSYEVLRQLLIQAAQTNGNAASANDAQAYATQQYDIYESSLSTSRPIPLPPGQTADQAYFSPDVLAVYQDDLTVENQITAIAGPNTFQGTTPPNRTPALVTWMQGALATESASISNVPGLTGTNLAASLPQGL